MNFIEFIKNKVIVIICIASFLSALIYNEVNLNQIPTEHIRVGETIVTNDDISYLVPPKNYLEKGEWKANDVGKQAYFIRPPGYGIFYGFFLKIAGFPLALKLLKITQLLLFAVSIYWLYFIALTFLNCKKWAIITATIYGLTPFSIGFLYYTLTEGITPSLLILFIFLLTKASQHKTNKTIFYVLAAFSFAFLVLVRPQLVFFGILIPFFLLKDYWIISIQKTIMKSALLLLIGFSFYGAWQYRNYKITNKWLPPHPIYYNDGNSFFRPPLKAYWNFVGGWAQEGATAYSYMVPMWKAAIKGDTSITYINNALATFPTKVNEYFTKERLINTFRDYQSTVLYQKPYFEKELPMPNALSKIESKTITEFNELTSEFKSHFCFDYYIKSPLKVFKLMAFHSNLSLYIFQLTYRGNWLMEIIRYLCFGLHSLLFLIMLVNLFNLKKMHLLFYGINAVVFIYVFYLCYFQRGIEERYTLPILPLLLIGFTLFSQQFVNRLKRFFDSVALRSE